MTTWTELMKYCAYHGVTIELVREAVRMLALTDEALRAYNEWRRQIAPSVLDAERAAQVAVLSDIRKRCHDEHSSTSRRWIESRDVVVTGPTNDDGVPVQCDDPICSEWNRLITETRKARQVP